VLSRGCCCLTLLGIPRSLGRRRPVWELVVSAGLGRLMGDDGGSGGAVSSGGEFQTARRGFVLIFVLHVSCVFF